MHKRMKAQAGLGGDSGYVSGINEQELAINAGSVLFDMDLLLLLVQSNSKLKRDKLSLAKTT
jgi:hypothetical protein